jgi:hypothetical protein
MLILVAGCSMARNPFSKTDGSFSTHTDREIERRIEAGDYDAAIERIERRRRENTGSARISSTGTGRLTPTNSSSDDVSQTSFQQQLPGVSASEIEAMIEQLVLLEPVSMRAQKREIYRRMSPSTLRQIIAGYEQANLIGQTRIAGNDLSQARDRINNSGAMNALQNAGFPDAPNPRNVVENRPLGMDTPWDQRTTQRTDQRPLPINDPLRMPNNSNVDPGGSRLQPAGGFILENENANGRSGIRQMSATISDIDRLTQAGRPTQQIRTNNSQLPQINPAGAAPRGNPFTPGFGREFDTNPPANNSLNHLKNGPGGIQLLTPQNVDQSQSGLQGIGTQRQSQTQFGIGTNQGSAVSTVPGIGEQRLPIGRGRGNLPLQTPMDRLTNRSPVTTRTDQGLNSYLSGGVQDRTEPTSLPGRFSRNMQNILPSIRNVAERTLPTFPGIGLGGPEPGSTGTIGNQPNAQNGLLLAIQSLEQQLATTAPGQTEQERLDYVQHHVALRTLYLIVGRNEQALVSIPGTDPTEQEFWQQMMWAVASYFDAQGVPNSSDRATQTIGQLRSAVKQLRSRANLTINNVAFCYKIDGFGHYDRFSRDRFKSGQPILLYAELKNFQSALVESDRFRTVMNSGIEIYRGTGNQELLGTIPFDVTEDFCRTQREDYFLAFEFSVPERLDPGTYTMVLKVEDQLNRKTALSRLNFVVTADDQ